MICLVWILAVLGLADPVESSREIRLMFKTCDVKLADTNASAHLVLVGEAGTSSDDVLIPGDVDRFNRGRVDNLTIKVDFEGPLCAVKIRRGQAGRQESWKLQWLSVCYANDTVDFSINDCETEDDWMEEKYQQYTRRVDGNWGDWGTWAQDREHLKCLRRRFRECDNPAPACGGAPCRGNSSETKCGLCSTVSVQTMQTREQPGKDDSYLAMWMVFAGFLVPVLSLFITTVVCYCLNRDRKECRPKELLDCPRAEPNAGSSTGPALTSIAQSEEMTSNLPDVKRRMPSGTPNHISAPQNMAHYEDTIGDDGEWDEEDDGTLGVSGAETRMLSPTSTRQVVQQGETTHT